METVEKINKIINESEDIFTKTRKKYSGGHSVDELGVLQLFSSKILSSVAKGKTDLNKLAILELVGRGQDENGKWVGFSESEKIFNKQLK